MKSKLIRTAAAVIFIIALLLSCAAGIIWYLHSPVSSEDNPSVYKVSVSRGAGIKSVAQELKQNAIIRSQLFMYYVSRYKKVSIKSGAYTVSSSMSVSEILSELQKGKPEYISVSIPEGMTVSRTAAVLSEKGIVGADEFILSCSDKDLLAHYSIPSQSFEGYLFPDTYFLTEGMKSSDIVMMMADNFFTRIQKIPGIEELSPDKRHAVVILASIVEREYRIASEAPLIASVFVNRNKYNIGLYSCATVEYIITEIQGRPHPDVITFDDLKIDNPYNTYLWAGLPPGPISNPGLTALSAAANPPKTPYFFFRLINPQTGEHFFSVDFDEHNQAGYETKKAAKR